MVCHFLLDYINNVNHFILALSRKSNSSNTNSTHPKNNECETKIEIISIIMKHITLIQDIKSLGRHLGLNTAELKRITTKNDLESIMVQMILEKYWNDEKFSLATLINVLNDDLNRRDVTQLIEKLLNKN